MRTLRSMAPTVQVRRSAVPASPETIRKVRQRLEVLQRLGVTERAIAAASGVVQSTVHRVRTGQIVKVSLSTAAALLRVTARPSRIGVG